MVAVSVDGPVGEHHIGLLALDHGLHLRIACAVHLGIAVNLPHKNMPYAHHAAGVLALLAAYGGRLVVAFAGNAGLAASEIHAHHLAALALKHQHGAAGNGFGVVGVCAHHERLLVVCLRNALCAGGQCAHGNHDRKRNGNE